MNVFASLASALGTIAPTLATMLGGPLAGTAVGALVSAFGLPASSTAADITRVIQTGAMTPDIIAKVRAADQEHEARMKQLDIDVLKLNAAHDEAFDATAAADRDSARKLQMAQPSMWPGILTALLTTAVCMVVGYDLWLFQQGKNLPDNQIIGALLIQWGVALSYWFGTTRSSSEKNNLLAQSMPASK